jgi:hypothetical protein
LKIIPLPGFCAGAVFNVPVRYDCDREGSIEAGNWEEYGLETHSGGVRYIKNISIGKISPGNAKAVLDLGKVRGTAEVYINGKSAGVRIWSPYRYDITGCLKEGINSVEIEVYNTLAPYIKAVSPSARVLNGQTVSGIFGPVRLYGVIETSA